MMKKRGYSLLELVFVLCALSFAAAIVAAVIYAARDPRTPLGSIILPAESQSQEEATAGQAPVDYVIDWIEPGYTVMVRIKDDVDVSMCNTDEVLGVGLREVSKEWHVVMPGTSTSRYNGVRAQVTTGITVNVRPKE
jgi:hypothetical protein